MFYNYILHRLCLFLAQFQELFKGGLHWGFTWVIYMAYNWQDLPAKQREIFDLFYNQNLSVAKIAARGQTTRQAVYNILNKLKKKGAVPEISTGGLQKRGMVNNKGVYKSSGSWRIEALIFMIKPYHIYPRYFKIMHERGNYSIPHKRWRIFLYKDTCRVQLMEGISFKDPDRLKAIEKAETDFNRFLYYAAHKYGFEYEKEGRVSISCKNMEIEKEDSKFAKGYIKESGEHFLQVKDLNGKVCFFVDQSKSDEHGYKGKDAFSHSENLEPYIKDFLYNNPLNNSQITMRLNDIITALEKQKEINQILLDRI